ncbi:hypothetical protein HOY80DRAFT_950430 [Tuber brumale]|nr:hypothetical protein HOY80DRAFT_950430 [Tuber brumale]
MHPIKFLALLLPSVHAAVHLGPLTYELFDVLTAPPFPWEELHSDPVPAETKITLQMPLAYRDQDTYEQRVLASHDSESPDYGKYIKPEEVDLMLGPTDETYETVIAWLALYGIPQEETKLERDWLSFETTVGKAEALLKAEYRWYVNRRNGDQVTLRCLGYSLPMEVRGMVRFVQPTTLFATRVGEREDSM